MKVWNNNMTCLIRSFTHSAHTSEDGYTQNWAVDNPTGFGCSSWPLRTRPLCGMLFPWPPSAQTLLPGRSQSHWALSLQWDEFQPGQLSWGLRKTQVTTSNLLSVISTAWSELVTKHLVILPGSADLGWDWICFTFLSEWNINISFFKQNLKLYFWLFFMGGNRGFQWSL